MAKYKVCPICGYLNPPTVLECEVCEGDLAAVRVSDSSTIVTEEPQESEQPAAAAPAAPDSPNRAARSFMKPVSEMRVEPDRPQTPLAGEPVRICEECGTRNPPNSRKCEKCGGDISYIMPAPCAAEKPKRYMLVSLDGAVTFPLCEGETVLGREAELSEYLGGRMYVGRRQAKIRLAGGKLTIENLKATNYTFVNNRSVDSRVVELKEGDEIGLGGNSVNGQYQELAAYFRIRAE